MDTCPRCTKPLQDHSQICPHCGVMVSFYSGPQIGPEAAQKVKEKRPRNVVDASGFPVVKVTLVLFCLGLIAWAMIPTRFSVEGLSPSRANETGRDPCLDKERCVLVYVTPWCPVCKQSVSVVRGLIRRYANSSQVGIKPIVGGRNAKQMEEMAAQIGRDTFLDAHGRFFASTGAKSVPHWFVIDAEGFLLKSFAGVYPTPQAMIEELNLEEDP